MAGFHQPFGKFDPRPSTVPRGRLIRPGAERIGFLRPVGRAHRVARKHMFDIGQHQFLVLLFVVVGQFHEWPDFAPGLIGGAADQGLGGVFHVPAVSLHVFQRRARQQTALGSLMAGSDRFVIGIEQEIIIGVKFPVRRIKRLEDKRLERPRRVRQMPFGRADIGHGLDTLVFRRQRRRQLKRAGANMPKQSQSFVLGLFRFFDRRGFPE